MLQSMSMPPSRVLSSSDRSSLLFDEATKSGDLTNALPPAFPIHYGRYVCMYVCMYV